MQFYDMYDKKTYDGPDHRDNVFPVAGWTLFIPALSRISFGLMFYLSLLFFAINNLTKFIWYI